VIGSWYGQKRAEIDLGGRFHRSRIRILSSQVSTIDPAWTGRWTKARRLGTAWEMIHRAQPERLITHRFAARDAAQAYAMLDQNPDQALQVVLAY
jgi:threonine dehydrogenase-like Zn-dependent dehydrogenase